jgi:hypothetical protein
LQFKRVEELRSISVAGPIEALAPAPSLPGPQLQRWSGVTLQTFKAPLNDAEAIAFEYEVIGRQREPAV